MSGIHGAAVLLVLLVVGPGSYAQNTLDPGKDPCALPGGIAPYAALRQADVAWERRVWRMIDLREPGNARMRSPALGASSCPGLFHVIRHGLLDEGAITAYDPGPLAGDDSFRRPFQREEIKRLFGDLDTMVSDHISRYMIKEDWIFDKQRSVMEVRIIGIAPMIDVIGEDGELRGHRVLFWLYYPECRLLFSRWAADQVGGDRPFSYEKLFAQRAFLGTITKVSNAFDRSIDEHSTTLDALLESEAIREQVFRTGFDLWNY